MCAAGYRSAIVVGLFCAIAPAASADSPVHEKKPVKLLSTVNGTYRMVLENQEVGRETFQRRTYDNNTVSWDVLTKARMSGADFVTRSSLVVDEESYFPRSFRSDKTIVHATDTLQVAFTVDLFSNVAVVGSEAQGKAGSRRLVVPTGVPVVELGAAYSWYQILFWTDGRSQNRQRIQWLDPQRGEVEDGEIFLTGQQTIDVLGKKTAVSVFKAERERLGSAILYVDSERRLVRCEQNVTVFELVEWTEKTESNGAKR